MKSRTVVIVIDGVLRKVIGNDPIPDGLILFSALASKFSVVLLSSKQSDMEWLIQQGVQYDMMSVSQDVSHANRVDTIRFEYGYDIAFVVEPDPEQAADLFDAGYTVLGFMHPYYSHPSWRPPYGSETPAETWTELRGVVVRDRLMRASDERTATRDE
jgi:hypothetical protein